MGDFYASEEFTVPTVEEIRDARPLAISLPDDVVKHAALIATTLVIGAECGQTAGWSRWGPTRSRFRSR